MPPGKGRKLLAAQLVIDESSAMAQAQPTLREAQEAFWTTGLSVFVFWNLGTLTGVLLGGIIGDPMVWGLDAAFPAAFFALLLPHLKKRCIQFIFQYILNLKVKLLKMIIFIIMLTKKKKKV